jgi:hypothetical protein
VRLCREKATSNVYAMKKLKKSEMLVDKDNIQLYISWDDLFKTLLFTGMICLKHFYLGKSYIRFILG